LEVVRKGNLRSYLSDYENVFKVHRTSVLAQATNYLQGLFATERNKRNIERMIEQTNGNYQQQQHFVSDSPWSAHEAMKVTAVKCQQRLGDLKKQAYSIDESSVRKSGKDSVGVSSQYNGNLGKIENSQTGVYASLSRGNQVGLINARLFLPDSWVGDPKRCEKAGIPKEARVKKTKIELALEMIREDLSRGIRFGWINADALYGNSFHFCNSIEDMGEDFVVDIHNNQRVFLAKPAIYLPELASKMGRKPTRLKTDDETVEVRKYCEMLKRSDFKKVKVRKGTKGWIKALVHTQLVWIWDGKESETRQRTLIVRKGVDKPARSGTGGEEIKFAMSNIDRSEKTIQQFAFMQSQRFWIERAFEDCKGELGMADYQVRKHISWYHHQALFFMAMDYVNEVKSKNQHRSPLLSVRDVRLLIIAYFMEDGVRMEKEVKDLLKRHEQRLKDIIRYYPHNDYF
jgi:SRSO17 transposase